MMDLGDVRKIGTAIDDIASTLEELTPQEAEAALNLVMVAVRARIAEGPDVRTKRLPPRVAAKAASLRTVEREDEEDDEPSADEAKLDRQIKASGTAAKGLESKIRRTLLTIQDLGEKAMTTNLADRWKISKGGVSFRMSPAKSRGLIEAPPKGGTGERPWRLTGKAIEWLEKHGGLKARPGELG